MDSHEKYLNRAQLEPPANSAAGKNKSFKNILPFARPVAA